MGVDSHFVNDNFDPHKTERFSIRGINFDLNNTGYRTNHCCNLHGFGNILSFDRVTYVKIKETDRLEALKLN
jgi:hypothetical protein